MRSATDPSDTHTLNGASHRADVNLQSVYPSRTLYRYHQPRALASLYVVIQTKQISVTSRSYLRQVLYI